MVEVEEEEEDAIEVLKITMIIITAEAEVGEDETTLETLRCIAIAYQPFMPGAAAKMLDLLGVAEGDRDLAALRRDGVAAGTVLPKPSAVFPRVEDESS